LDDKLEHAWNIKTYLCQFIQGADTKASAVIAACTFCVTLLSLVPSDLVFIEALLFSFCTFPLLMSAWFAISCLLPRGLSGSESKTIFFMRVAEYPNATEYCNAFATAEPLAEVLIQNYELSLVAKRKYEVVTEAIRWLGYGLCAFCLSILVLKIFHPKIVSALSKPQTKESLRLRSLKKTSARIESQSANTSVKQKSKSKSVNINQLQVR
jgi:hypothetical protein